MPLLLGGGGQGYRARGVSVPPPPSVRRAPALAEEEVAVGTASRCRAVLPRSSAKIKIKKAEGGGCEGEKDCLLLTGASADFCGAERGVTSGFRGGCLP